MCKTLAFVFRAWPSRALAALGTVWTTLSPMLAWAAGAAGTGADPFPPETAARDGGVGILNIIFIAFAVYVVWRMFSRSRRNDKDDSPPTYTVTPEDDANDDRQQDKGTPDEIREARAKAAWDHLSSEPKRESPQAPSPGPGSENIGTPLPNAAASRNQGPPGFNHTEFLRGAKAMYARIRDSWAKRDLADLRQFAAPDMMTQFEQWASESPDRTEIAVMLVDARVLDVKTEGAVTIVDVAYEATISDAPQSKESRKVSEVWRFSEDSSLRDATWLLEKMEQKQ